MNIKLFRIACCVIILFSSCKKKKDLFSLLAEDCYWDIKDRGSLHPINSCYKFDKFGECNFYYYYFFNKERTDSVFLFDTDDVIVSNKWKIEGDSIIIRTNKYHIISFNSDSLIVTATGKDTMMLIKNCKTFNPGSQ